MFSLHIYLATACHVMSYSSDAKDAFGILDRPDSPLLKSQL